MRSTCDHRSACLVSSDRSGGIPIERSETIADAAALIVAAGRGRRMKSVTPKQYLDLAGEAVLARSVSAFLAADWITQIIVVIHADDADLYNAAVAKITDPRLGRPVVGGETRSQSVQSGLKAMAAGAPERVLIHDAARPLVSLGILRRVTDALDHCDGAFAAIPVVDALWSSRDDCADAPVPRDGLWRAQTPQGFRFDAILRAHANADETAADDVAVARAAGLAVRIVEGDEQNFKITTPADIARAEAIFRQSK